MEPVKICIRKYRGFKKRKSVLNYKLRKALSGLKWRNDLLAPMRSSEHLKGIFKRRISNMLKILKMTFMLN